MRDKRKENARQSHFFSCMILLAGQEHLKQARRIARFRVTYRCTYRAAAVKWSILLAEERADHRIIRVGPSGVARMGLARTANAAFIPRGTTADTSTVLKSRPVYRLLVLPDF